MQRCSYGAVPPACKGGGLAAPPSCADENGTAAATLAAFRQRSWWDFVRLLRRVNFLPSHAPDHHL